MATDAAQRASQLLAADEARFVDFDNVLGLMSSERIVIDGA